MIKWFSFEIIKDYLTLIFYWSVSRAKEKKSHLWMSKFLNWLDPISFVLNLNKCHPGLMWLRTLCSIQSFITLIPLKAKFVYKSQHFHLWKRRAHLLPLCKLRAHPFEVRIHLRGSQTIMSIKKKKMVRGIESTWWIRPIYIILMHQIILILSYLSLNFNDFIRDSMIVWHLRRNDRAQWWPWIGGRGCHSKRVLICV